MRGTARHTDEERRGERCAGGCVHVVAKLRRENLELKQQAGYYRTLHRKAVARERRLKEQLSGVRTKARELRQQLRERRARRNNKSEKRAKSGSGSGSRRQRRARGASNPGRHGRRDLSAGRRRNPQAGAERRCCPKSGSTAPQRGLRGAGDCAPTGGSSASTTAGGCAGVPRVLTAPAPSRLIPKGILGVSIWVQVLLDKYRFHRPTYRLLEDLSTHGLELAQGTVRRPETAGAAGAAAEALRARNLQGGHADETGWYVFEATLPALVSVGVLGS